MGYLLTIVAVILLIYNPVYSVLLLVACGVLLYLRSVLRAVPAVYRENKAAKAYWKAQDDANA